uniref:DUF8039 domain-containing protein n=1 Tax=Cannabis sativa TaxID=3483 RepID=A0A803QC80_CANSA
MMVVMESPLASKRFDEATFNISPINEEYSEDEINITPKSKSHGDKHVDDWRRQATSPLNSLKKIRRSLQHIGYNEHEDNFNTPQRNGEIVMNIPTQSRMTRTATNGFATNTKMTRAPTKGSPFANTRSSHRQAKIETPLNYDHENSLDNIPEHVTQKKRRRGQTKMKGIALTDGRIAVRFNAKGQAVGDGSVSLASFVGPLVREIVPYTITDWRKSSKNNERCVMVDNPERLKLKPDNIKSETEWRVFVREKTSKEFRNRESSKPVTRVEASLKTHTKKNGEPVNAQDVEVIGFTPPSEGDSHIPPPSPTNVNLKFTPENNACNLLDWYGGGEIVAKDRWASSDPNCEVHHLHLGPNAMKVCVDLVKKPDAYLWRPTSIMSTIKEAVGSIIAWPTNKVIMR